MEHGSDYLMRLIWWSAHQWKRFKQGSIKVWVSMEWDDCRCRTIWVPVSQKDEKQLKSSTIRILRSLKDSGSRFFGRLKKISDIPHMLLKRKIQNYSFLYFLTMRQCKPWWELMPGWTSKKHFSLLVTQMQKSGWPSNKKLCSFTCLEGLFACKLRHVSSA